MKASRVGAIKAIEAIGIEALTAEKNESHRRQLVRRSSKRQGRYTKRARGRGVAGRYSGSQGIL